MPKNDTLTLYSSIKPTLMKTLLFRGTIISALGVAPMLYASIFLDTQALSKWGALIFFGSLAMIALGLLPYRRLTLLERTPNKLVISDKDEFSYIQKGKKILTIPLASIKTIKFLDQRSSYGLALNLKKSSEKKIIVHDSFFDFSSYQKHCRKRYGSDLFLPYFSKNSFKVLEDLVITAQTGQCRAS